VSSFPRSPRPVPAPKPLAVALDAAFDGVARDDPRGPATDESTRRPRWLLAPTDDAGRARPTEPRPPELRDVSATPRFDPSSLRVDAKDLATRSKFARQFWAIKSRLMDCVVMCRHGSFYNLFDVDADVGMSVGLRLSGKPAAFMQKVGCFHDAFDAWAGKILARGYAVARIEETSEKNADGIVRREIAEILTPALARGLVGAANADRPEALLALAESSDAADAAAADASLDASVSLGVAVLDAEAGEVLLGSFADGPERDHLRAFLALVEPREVVFSRRRKEGKLSPATLAALRRHARDAEDDERLAGEAGSGGALGGGLGLFRSSRTSIACRAIERGAAPLPDFDREDVISAAARFAGIDPNAAPPPAVADASPVATEALAYLIRHVAWAGAAGRALAGARFRTLRGSVRDALSGRYELVERSVEQSRREPPGAAFSGRSDSPGRVDGSGVTPPPRRRVPRRLFCRARSRVGGFVRRRAFGIAPRVPRRDLHSARAASPARVDPPAPRGPRGGERAPRRRGRALRGA
jgi:DNA mismatch repair protein MSH6